MANEGGEKAKRTRENRSVICCLFLSKINKMVLKPQFSELIFGHSAGSTKLDRLQCEQFRYFSANKQIEGGMLTSCPLTCRIGAATFGGAVGEARPRPHSFILPCA